MISLIIPCFNEEESLPLFYPEATSVLRQMNCDYELIFVNDGSRDRTLEILKELSEKDPHVIYLSFSRNFGKEAAMYAGFCNAGGDYVAVNYYPYTRDNGESYYTGDTSCYFALFEVTLHEISEPNPFGLKYAICPVIRLDNADFEFEARYCREIWLKS